MAVDSQFLIDQKEIIRDRIIPWEGLSRANVITEDELNYIKILDKQSIENKKKTITQETKLYASFLLNLLNKLDNNPREDVLKNLLCLFNDLLLDLPSFSEELVKLSSVDDALPFEPFLKVLSNNDLIIKTLSLYNLVILLNYSLKANVKISNEILVKVFHELTSLVNNDDLNYKFVNIQLLQLLIIPKPFKASYGKSNFLKNFKSLSNLITIAANQTSINSSNLQLVYNGLLNIWILSFNAHINKLIYTNFPELISSLLTLANDSIKLKIIRLSVSILKNLVSVTDSGNDKFKIIKLILHNDGLNLIDNLQGRKISSNGSDEELTNDLTYLSEELHEIVTNKLTSFDEYLTELENPNLLSWASPTHKSTEFWIENSFHFRENSWSLVKKIFQVLSAQSDSTVPKIILLNDLQFLINNLGQDLVNFINDNKDYKLLIMNLLDNNSDNELKYQALKTIQLLVGHNY